LVCARGDQLVRPPNWPTPCRRCPTEYAKAARFIDMMEQDRTDSKGGPGQGAKPREILVGPEYLEKSGRA
jgi:hypothetical protein